MTIIQVPESRPWTDLMTRRMLLRQRALSVNRIVCGQCEKTESSQIIGERGVIHRF